MPPSNTFKRGARAYYTLGQVDPTPYREPFDLLVGEDADIVAFSQWGSLTIKVGGWWSPGGERDWNRSPPLSMSKRARRIRFSKNDVVLVPLNLERVQSEDGRRRTPRHPAVAWGVLEQHPEARDDGNPMVFGHHSFPMECLKEWGRLKISL